MTEHNSTCTRVVVIGGDYAGTGVANRLRRRGKATAVRQLVMTGAKQVATILTTLLRPIQRRPDTRIEPMICNSEPAVAIYSGDLLKAVLVLDIADGMVINGYAIRNPDKLAALASARTITRNPGIPSPLQE
ncbi:hypothetical protein AB0L63_04400 [Nocardia sp. NPDC051990]|uniref:hypothetical protein n=1 Tax=Nocardia sp. NPDC051990 TaxID=3155285 RepID=UPI00343EE24A